MEREILEDNKLRYTQVIRVKDKDDVKPITITFPDGGVLSVKKALLCVTEIEELKKGKLGELAKRDRTEGEYYSSVYGVFTVQDVLNMYMQAFLNLVKVAQYLKETDAIKTAMDIIEEINSVDSKEKRALIMGVVELLFR